MIRPGSVWTATTEVPSYPSLTDDRQAEVVVIGAGIVGLTTALLLTQRGLRVVVVEASRIGDGTTGHTTGKLTTQHGLRYADLIDRVGPARARRYAEANAAALDLATTLVRDHDIDCDLTTADALAYTRKAHRRRALAKEVEASRQVGLEAHLDTGTDLPFGAVAAVRFPDQLHLHPVRYLAGLAHAITAAGGEIVESSRVTSVSQADGQVQAATASGTVRASWAVVATLLPLGNLGGVFARTSPAHSHGLAVRLREAAPTDMTISVDSPTRSTRPWDPHDPNTLIVAGNGHHTGTGDPVKARDRLEHWVEENFEVAAVEHRWSAHDHVPVGGLPFVGRAPLTSNVLVATGFAKWGLSAGTAAAGVLADIVTGRHNPWTHDVDPGRLGGLGEVARTVVHNAEVGAQFVAGHLRSFVGRDARPLCTHVGCRVTWNGADDTWDCPCHGSRFAPDGSVIAAPAVDPLRNVPPHQPR